jgi:hypothetical protein
MNKISKWLIKENLHDVRYMTQVIRYIRNERMTADSIAAYLDVWYPTHGITDAAKAEIVVWKMIECTLKDKEADMHELFETACAYADAFLMEYSFLRVKQPSETSIPVHVPKGSKKERAKQLFVLKYSKENRDTIRKELLQEFEQLGMTKQGAVTYFHKFEKGEW